MPMQGSDDILQLLPFVETNCGDTWKEMLKIGFFICTNILGAGEHNV